MADSPSHFAHAQSWLRLVTVPLLALVEWLNIFTVKVWITCLHRRESLVIYILLDEWLGQSWLLFSWPEHRADVIVESLVLLSSWLCENTVALEQICTLIYQRSIILFHLKHWTINRMGRSWNLIVTERDCLIALGFLSVQFLSLISLEVHRINMVMDVWCIFKLSTTWLSGVNFGILWQNCSLCYLLHVWLNFATTTAYEFKLTFTVRC